ncbi:MULTISPECIES: site-specific integrase [Xanthomonas]|uniref:Integrase/recombinase protein XerD n=2 Tax=Xanthomonas TaxID=338 RepID=A0A0K2ZPW9_9XANT|nr:MULTISPECIES: site-specific integrase [Xanthomonas]MCE4373585.1 site-specific integrase [Xanthomonas hortorum pv. hederae]MDC8640648.1 site-specific integrase [Xanthomonas hortorum pv. hederae]PPU73242.1 Tn3 family resolvase [Xanthomonas hortorum pv. hederae]PUE93977.1 Tn3 family resolvase [Xanthomonas hortorum pv. hederae]UKE67450.1 site-specific integrase [Xanthomonas translucens pv. phlei]
MSELERYLQAAIRDNTRKSYQSALRHFEVAWGGYLPATPDSVSRYLVHYATELAANTLRQRLAALAQWHAEHGFSDPTRAPVVRKVLKGIQTLHPSQEKRATPLQLTQLGQVVDWLDGAAAAAGTRGDLAGQLRHLRDRALVLLGFWRGFRGDELVRLQVQDLRLVPGEGMTCFLPHSKGDRQHAGRTYKVPALSRWCPVATTSAWVAAADLHEGPLFRAVDQWGGIAATPLHPNSLVRLLRRIFREGGLASPDDYSGHSLRRGFAGWANANGWDVKALMEYVGWRDVHSAMRYLDGADPFARQRIEASLPPAPTPRPALPAPVAASVPTTVVEAAVTLTRFNPRVRGLAKAHRLIEKICLQPHQAQRLNTDGTRYRLAIAAADEAVLEETIAMLLDEMHRIADNHQCFLAVALRDEAGGRHWD